MTGLADVFKRMTVWRRPQGTAVAARSGAADNTRHRDSIFSTLCAAQCFVALLRREGAVNLVKINGVWQSPGSSGHAQPNLQGLPYG